MQAGDVEAQQRRRRRRPAVRVADARGVRVRRVVQRAVDRVAFDERAVRHPLVVQHEPPLAPHQRQRALVFARQEVRLELEPADERRDGGVGLGRRRAVRSPAGLKRGGDQRRLLGPCE